LEGRTVWLRIWSGRAWFQFGLSVSSVKVVRHNRRTFFCGRLWETEVVGTLGYLNCGGRV